jgi:hypothetical protein
MNVIHPETKIMNFTPHDIKIVADDGTLIKSYPSVGVARVKQESKFIGFADGGTAFFKSTFGEVENLPLPAMGIVLIVSSIVKAACPDRDDLVVPCGFVRDACQGMIIGATGLSF